MLGRIWRRNHIYREHDEPRTIRCFVVTLDETFFKEENSLKWQNYKTRLNKLISFEVPSINTTGYGLSLDLAI